VKHRILSNPARYGKCGQSHSPSPLVAFPSEYSVFYHTNTQSPVLFICTAWNAILHTADIQTEKLFQEKVRSLNITTAWWLEVILQNHEDKQATAQLDSAPHQIWTTTPWYLWNTQFFLMNTLVRQILYKGMLTRNASKFWWCICKVCQKKILISLVMYTQKQSVEEQCLINLAACARTHTHTHKGVWKSMVALVISFLQYLGKSLEEKLELQYLHTITSQHYHLHIHTFLLTIKQSINSSQ
jgi:hypothetical protein